MTFFKITRYLFLKLSCLSFNSFNSFKYHQPYFKHATRSYASDALSLCGKTVQKSKIGCVFRTPKKILCVRNIECANNLVVHQPLLSGGNINLTLGVWKTYRNALGKNASTHKLWPLFGIKPFDKGHTFSRKITKGCFF